MNDKQTGGPAFPSTSHNGWGEPEKGMTLRDYFAAKAMQSLLQIKARTADGLSVACDAYIMADAMLKTREAGV